MNVSKTISDISLYLELYPIKEESSKKGTFSISEIIKRQNLPGVAVAESGDGLQNAEFIESILEYCPEDKYDDMIAEYGEDSVIGQIIRKKRAKKYQDELLSKSIEDMESVIEKTLISSLRYDNPFYQVVCQYIDEKGYKSDADFYNFIGMPRQLFARTRNPEANLSKKTALWIIIGLQLNFKQATSVLSLAGFAFKKNDKRDAILSYILRNTKYTIFEVNEILYHFNVEPFC